MFGKCGGEGVGWEGGVVFSQSRLLKMSSCKAPLSERRGCGTLAAARLQMLPVGFSIQSHLSSKVLREHMRRMNPR